MVIDRAARTVTWPASGDTYIGATGPLGSPEGQGELRYANGDAYVGGFLRGERHGPGAYHHGASGVVTVGDFARDHPVGTALIWSADRRRAWCMLDGKLDMEYKRVAPVDAATVHTRGLEWHPVEHGQLPLDRAYRLAVTNGLEEVARAVGAPRRETVNETAFLPGAPNFVAPGRAYTPSQRQAAVRDGGLRPTVRERAPADVWPWPLVRGEAPYGEEPSERILVERSIFTKPQNAASAAAVRAADSRAPAGSADRDALYRGIIDDMEPWRTELPRRQASMGRAGASAHKLTTTVVGEAASVPWEASAAASAPPHATNAASWFTRGTGPLQPTPQVPN